MPLTVDKIICAMSSYKYSSVACDNLHHGMLTKLSAASIG
jgi:hypothetical protein